MTKAPAPKAKGRPAKIKPTAEAGPDLSPPSTSPALPAAPPPPAVAPAVDLFEGYVSEHVVAEQRKVTTRYLRMERQQETGPPFIKVGRDVRYSVQGFRDWLKAHETKPGEPNK